MSRDEEQEVAVERYQEITRAPPKEDALLDHRRFRASARKQSLSGGCSLLILLATLCFTFPFVALFLYSGYWIHASAYYLITCAVGALGTVTGALTVWTALQATRANARHSAQLTTYARSLEERQRAQSGSISITVDAQQLHGAMEVCEEGGEEDRLT